MRIRRREWGGWVVGAWQALAGVSAAGLAAATSPEAGHAAARQLQLWGYLPWWMKDQRRSRELIVYHRLKFFDIEISDDGRLSDRHGWPQRWESLLAAVRAQGGKFDITITLFDTRRFERVFGNAERRELLLAEILALARTADGIQLDVEVFDAVSAGAVAGFRGFCARLKAALAALGTAKSLSAFGVMGAAVDLYDPAALELFDYIVVQGYDAHHAGSPRSGPVAPLRGPYGVTWESTLRHYLSLGLQRRKIIFGVPFYGYEWPTVSDEIGAPVRGKGIETTYAPIDARVLPNIRVSARTQASIHGLRRDPASGSPYYVFQEYNGRWCQGWFEDEQSLSAKLAFVQREGLAGVAVFPIGYDNGAFDSLLERNFKGR